MKTDVEISQQANMLPINEVAEKYGIEEDDIELYGKYKAKLSDKLMEKLENRSNGKLILVTAINPTPAGEGKTTLNIGLSMALNEIGKSAITTLREPSLGPSFGIKGGATGGGYSQVLPMEDINLHFTGDFHAITSAVNLISALIDNHIHQGNELEIDTERVLWKRALDMNDRVLRNVVVGLGGKVNGVVREDGFDISVASEMMAILCLSKNLMDLKKRVGNILIAYDVHKNPIYAKQINCEGAVTLLLKDAIKPNIVQTVSNTLAIIHGGPFANIAHGCNSLIATKIALKLADYVVTEAGFGADLGAEKFMDIKCQLGDLKPNAVVIVASIKALKHHGNIEKSKLSEENIPALKKGYKNLERHIFNLKKFKVPIIVALNRFITDTQEEIDFILEETKKLGIDAILCEVWEKGAKGGVLLANKVVELVEEKESEFKPLYDLEMGIFDKISKIAKEIYGAKDVTYTAKAIRKIEELEKSDKFKVPICMAKTQYSFSDNPKLLGAPTDFEITVKDVKLNNGAGFLVVYTGDIMTMPGLPKIPAANNMDIDKDGKITGLF